LDGKGQLNGTKQIVIVYDGKTAIIDKNTGQIIDSYLGSELRGLIHLERLR
jgi:predicted Ser/Thr protein kinase